MLRVKKPKPPKFLTSRRSEAAIEIKKIIDWYKNYQPKKGNFPFSAYKNQAIKEALEKVFHGKCAYCETRYGAGSNVDVEHFRPKSEVKNSDIDNPSLGYYWLALAWENLLPSCQSCNRRWKRKLFGKEKTELTGKGTLFPLENPKKRARNTRQLLAEKPLLLHPYFDNPDAHLNFEVDGLVYPVHNGKKISTKGETSIRIYGLCRETLVLERKIEISRLFVQLKRIEEITALVSKNKKSKPLLNLLKNEYAELKKFLDKKNLHSTMLKQIIKKHFK